MNIKSWTLRKQFLVRILLVLLIIALISGSIQLYFMHKQIVTETNQQANMIAKNVMRGIEETNLASQNIEHQIDLKLKMKAMYASDLLKGKNPEELTEADLKKIRDKLGLAGLTILAPTPGKKDIVAVASTEKQEIGFSLKKFGYYDGGMKLLNNEKPDLPGASYLSQNMITLPIVQSASHEDKPVFFKYAYYHAPGTEYIINPYIEANEVYQYTKNVGPQARITQIEKENNLIDELAILNPRVFADPSLEKQLFPPMKKVSAGQFKRQTKQDLQLLKKPAMKKTFYISKINGHKIYKMFLPLDKNHVIYLALDYSHMTGPLYRHSAILIISGLIALLSLFLLAASFFNRIYDNIQRIIRQIRSLEDGDLTVKSDVKDNSELQMLSQSANRMVDTWHRTLKETIEQANKVRRVSVLLEADAGQSVEKMYEMSAETTLKEREQLDEMNDNLDELASYLMNQKEDSSSQETVLQKIEGLKHMIRERTVATTDMTITLSELLESLHNQSSEMSKIANALLESMKPFRLRGGELGDLKNR